MTSGDMVIVGAGEAGASAAAALREKGFNGGITLIGDEAHSPYERPPLSKAAIIGEMSPEPTTILDKAKIADLDISHLATVRATGIDRQKHYLLLDDGRVLPYERLLLATGARARRLSVPGAEDTVLYLRTYADALVLRERLPTGTRLVVIGGGFIGLEIAASAVTRGCVVTLLELAPRILMRGVPKVVADHVADRHRKAGVDLMTGIGIEAIEKRERGSIVRLTGGMALEADVVVAGVGAAPNVAVAEASGLAVENGICVNGQLRTEDPCIYAAGDCCSFPHPLYDDRRIRLEAWRNAQAQGAHAAGNMLGRTDEYAAVPWFWSDQYDETLQVAGICDGEVVTIERDLGSGRLFFHLNREGRLVAASGVGQISAIAREIRLSEMMIAQQAYPDQAALASPSVKLKTLLAQ